MKNNHQKYVVIVGCGLLGSFLANKYSKVGNSVVVIDPDPESFVSLSSDFSGFTIDGNASEFAVLDQAKIEKADLLIAATEKDSMNLYIAHVAKTHFQVPEVIARVFDPELTSICEGTGITTICPALISMKYISTYLSENNTQR